MRDGCRATVRGDQYICDQCGITWDLDDKDLPVCRPVVNVGTPGHVDHGKSDPKIEKKEINKIREILK